VERDREESSLAQPFEKWPVHVPDMLLEDVIEIAHRLVEMDAEDKTERVQLVALREAKPSRQVARSFRPDTVELRLDVERDAQILELVQVGEIAD